MNTRKNILIFNDYDTQDVSCAIKEVLVENKDFLPNLFAEYEIRGFIQNYLAELMYGDYSATRSWWRRLKTKVSTKNVDVAEFINTDFIQKKLPHKKIRNIFRRYTPSLVLCLGKKSIVPAIAARKKMALNTKIGVVVCSYVLDRRMVQPDVDFYIVPTLAIKAEIVQLGIAEDKIEVLPILIRQELLDTPTPDTALPSLGLNPNLPTVMILATFSYNPKFRQLVTYLQKAKLKMNILVACGYDRNLLSDIHDIASPTVVGRNEGLDMRLAYGAADIVITRPRSENLANCIAKKKVIITYDIVGEIEKRTADLLSMDYVINCTSAEEVLGTLESYLDNKKAYIDAIKEPDIDQAECARRFRAIVEKHVV